MHLNHTQKASRPLALVTGASSGIGADLARELARDGHDLVLVARREALLQTLAVELAGYGARATVIATNLGACLAASRLGAELERLGLRELDVLVNDAGFGDYADFIDAEPTKLSEMLHLNVVALTELTRVFLPGMVARRRGKVLLLGAMAGFTPGPGCAVYHATKAYVLNLGDALARELAGSGVSLTTLCPGPTASGFHATAGAAVRISGDSLGAARMESAEVARLGYQAMKEGRSVAPIGLGDQLRVGMARSATGLVMFGRGEG